MNGCLILQMCNMFKACTPDKMGLIDTPAIRFRSAAYNTELKKINSETPVYSIEVEMTNKMVATNLVNKIPFYK